MGILSAGLIYKPEMGTWNDRHAFLEEVTLGDYEQLE
jgi:hypothetical protein